MSQDWQPQDPKTILANALTNYLEAVKPLREATIGYRNSMIDQGMTAESADRCAADFHHVLVLTLFNQMSGKK